MGDIISVVMVLDQKGVRPETRNFQRVISNRFVIINCTVSYNVYGSTLQNISH